MECRRSEFPLKTHPRAAEAEAAEDDAKVPEFVFVKADALDEANRRNKSAPPRFIIFTERFKVSSFVEMQLKFIPHTSYLRETYSR